jgi:ribonuclease HII
MKKKTDRPVIIGFLDKLKAVPTAKARDGLFSPLYLFDQAQGIRPLAGLDEAGRGPLAGPLVAGAVILPENFDHKGINDSKMLSANDRAKAFEVIISQALHWAYAVMSPAQVDELNPLGASMRAMAEAVAKFPIKPALALVDGDKSFFLDCPFKTVVKGDSKSLSIAAASIVAKVVRDRLMDEEHTRYPVYGFDRNKGYGTKKHLEALAKYGPSPIHRVSFRGVRPEVPPEPGVRRGPTLF